MNITAIAVCAIVLSIYAPINLLSQTDTTQTEVLPTDTTKSKGKKKGRLAALTQKLGTSDAQNLLLQQALKARAVSKSLQESGMLSKEQTKTAMQATKTAIDATLTDAQKAQLDSIRAAAKQRKKEAKSKQ